MEKSRPADTASRLDNRADRSARPGGFSLWNRVVTDSISNWFFTTSETANTNLRQSGVGDDRIFLVGNTMIDTLRKQLPRLRKPEVWNSLRLENKKYFVLTLHRPGNRNFGHQRAGGRRSRPSGAVSRPPLCREMENGRHPAAMGRTDRAADRQPLDHAALIIL